MAGKSMTPFCLKVVTTKTTKMQWKLDLADTDLAENLDLKDILQQIWVTIFDF